MTEMQRYGMHANGTVRAVPYLDGDWVLASDAEAAIAAAEQRGWKRGWDEAQDVLRGRKAWQAYEQGQRDILARCIAAVEALPYWQDEVLAPEVWVSRAAAIAAIKGDSDDCLAALRALGGPDA